jgi:hypothetical protein
MAHQTARMLVEAGIIPKNVIQQLAHYHLVPEDYAELHGTRPLKTSSQLEVEGFIKELSAAITKDMAEIRETEFDRPGGYRRIFLMFENDSLDGEDDVLIDRFGRLVVPNEAPWNFLKAVRYPEERVHRMVVNKEPRYSGEQAEALVVYVESPEDIKEGGN